MIKLIEVIIGAFIIIMTAAPIGIFYAMVVNAVYLQLAVPMLFAYGFCTVYLCNRLIVR